MAALVVPPPPGTTLVTLQTLVAYFNWGLFGVLSAQLTAILDLFHDASQRHPWDSRKIAVYTIYTLQIAQTALITFAGYKYPVEGGLGNVQPGNDPKLGYIAVPIISGIVSCMAQVCYARRFPLMWTSRWAKWLGWGISIIALAQSSAAVAEGVQSLVVGRFSELIPRTFVLRFIRLTGSAFCNISITVFMISIFFKLLRHGIQLSRAHTIIARMVYLFAKTGLLTTLAATTSFVLFLVSPTTTLYAPADLVIAPLYAVSLLVLANDLGGCPASARPTLDAAFVDLDLELPGRRRRCAPIALHGTAGQLVPNRLGTVHGPAQKLLDVRIDVQRESRVDGASDVSDDGQRRSSSPGAPARDKCRLWLAK